MIADKQRFDFRCHLRSIRSSFNKVVPQPVTLTNVSLHALVVEPILTVAFLSAGMTYIEEAELFTSEMV